MATVRYLVESVDKALPFYQALGFELTERWGPPFAIVQRDDLSLWLSGPGTSASKTMPNGSMPHPGGWNRLVIEVDDLDAAIADLMANPDVSFLQARNVLSGCYSFTATSTRPAG